MGFEWEEDSKTTGASTEQAPADTSSSNDKPSGGYSKKPYVKKEFIAKHPFNLVVTANEDISPEVADELAMVAKHFASLNFTIRYPRTIPALDVALKRDIPDNRLAPFLPWKGFKLRGSEEELNAEFYVNDRAVAMMSLENSGFENVPKPVRRIAAIHGALVYGPFAESPALAVLMHSPDGVSSSSNARKETGYVQGVLKVAEVARIPVFNIGDGSYKERLNSFVSKYS